MTGYSREPLDSDDDPSVNINYNVVPIIASRSLKYVPMRVSASEQLVAPDILLVLREVLLVDHNSDIFRCPQSTDLLRFPAYADTRGELVADIVYRTPVQGDYAARVVIPGRVSENGKILYY